MDKENLIKYTPWLVVAIAFFLQYNLFVTPQMLERTHRKILSEISKGYITKSEFGIVKESLADINKKVDKIFDILVNKK